MAKIKLPQKPHCMVILFFNKGKKILSNLSSQATGLTPREIIELGVIHISIKTHVLR